MQLRKNNKFNTEMFCKLEEVIHITERERVRETGRRERGIPCDALSSP
jgi:hypothetical protein